MSIIGRKKTDGPQDEVKSSGTEGKGSWFKDNQRPIIAVGLIVIMAFVMRFVFAFGVSADSAFALSGGVLASEHLHTITEILDGGSFFGTDNALNYPFGSANSNPILIDAILAGIAMIGTALGMSAVKAASLTLATFSLACGTLAVIPMFFLGKEVVGTKKAGYVAAIFIAFCPVVITQTVFSNGTETGWILLLFITLSLFVLKGLKAIVVSMRTEESLKGVLTVNKPAIRLAAISGLILALIVLSTNGFRSIVVLLIVAMIIMVIAGRFMYRDTRMVALFFSIIIAIGMAVASAYYIPALLWDQVLSGILILSVASIVLCVTFSLLQRTPWIITVPVYVIAVTVVLVLLSFFMPDLYSDIIKGNTIYADVLVPLSGSVLSVSHLSTNFGVVPMWLTVLVIGIMIWRLPKNISSFAYQFLVVFMLGSVLFSTKSDVLSTIFSPVYAIGFAYVIMWIFDHVDFKTYFMMIKNAELKSAWKKILRPVPVATILAVGALLCVPIGMYAIDAGISSNNADDYEGMDLGALSYFVKTDSDWMTGSVLSTYKDDNAKNGALVTWLDYSDDAATKGGFDVITDSQGNGAEAASNILLSNAVDGSSTAAMLIYLLTYNQSFGSDIETALNMGDKFEGFKKIIENPSEYRSEVLGDIDKYGILRSDISDDNIRYIRGIAYLKDNGFDAYTISEMYSKVSAIKGKSISYFMVDGNMFPMYYGYSSLFSTIGYVNGYALTDNYGTVGQFLTVDYYTYYFGLYGYKDAMYDTLLWRAYIGPSPTEAEQGSASEYLTALMKSDGTVKAHPGYGLANFEVDYDHWYVMYNPDEEAEVSGDGWVKMLYKDAIAEQEKNAGLINYLSGLPAVLKYVSNNSGHVVSGYVKTADDAAIKGVRVSVIDSEGTVCGTTYTNDEGKYNILVTGTGSQINYYTGSETLADGTLIRSVAYSDTMEPNYQVPYAVGSGKFVDADGKDISEKVYNANAVMTITGRTTGNTYTLEKDAGITATGFTWDAARKVVPDVYDVTLVSSDGKVSYVSDVTITVGPGSNSGIEVKLSTMKVTLNIKDDIGANKKIGVRLIDRENGTAYPTSGWYPIDDDGVIEAILVGGTYDFVFNGDYVTDFGPLTVTSSTSENVSVFKATPVAFTGFPTELENRMVTIYTTSYQTTGIIDGTGKVTVNLPDGNGAAINYTAYIVDGTNCYIANSVSGQVAGDSYTVSGTMKNSSSGETSGTILFIRDDGSQIPVGTASNGSYSAVLKAGTYTVYANNGSQVKIERMELTGNVENKEIVLEEGKQVSFKTTYYSTSYGLPYVPVTVSDIEGCADCTFIVVSNSTGSGSFYIPSASNCNMTAKLSGTTPFYYGTTASPEDNKTINSSATSLEFNANVKKISITNHSGYKVKINGTEIEDSASPTDVSVMGTSTEVTIVSDDLYTKKTLYMTKQDIIDGKELPAAFFDGETMYCICNITVSDSNDVVTVKALDDEKSATISKTTYGTTRTYYLQQGGDFQITIRNSDSTKVKYERVDDIAALTPIDATALSDAATITGFVGLSKSGEMTLKYLPESLSTTFKFDISSGRYTILVPLSTDLRLMPEIVDEQSDIGYEYTATRDITALTAAGTYTYNLAVTSATIGGTNTITADDPTIVSMTDTAISEVVFKTKFINSATAPETMTYTLSGGSDWSNLSFYQDEGCTIPITNVTFSDATADFIYGKGIIVMGKVGFSSDNLTVILTDINGEEACTAMITGFGDWKSSTPSKDTTKVDITSNSVGDSEYKYGIKIVNDDNFTKHIKLEPTGITSDWIVTYVYGSEINTTGEFDIKGHVTATVFVKITSMSGTSENVEIPTISTKVTVTGAGVSEISTDTSEAVTIEGCIATVSSSATESTVTVDETSATGRDVLNEKSEMPTYIWVAIAVMIALVFLIIWAASKRGVFSRRK